MLSGHQLDFIIKDLNHRGIVAEEIQDELIDHVCTAVEAEMAGGLGFVEAYHKVLHRFGHNQGLRDTQRETVKSENNTLKLMLRNYITVAFRNLRKQRFYTLINMFGLAVGIASCLTIVLYMSHELRYDKHHQDIDRLYRVNAEIKFGANHLRLAVCPAPMADVLRHDYPEVEHAARFLQRGSHLIKLGDENIKETRIVYADSSIFNIFTIPFVEGNPQSALREPNSVVLSETAAAKYFPDGNAMGQSLIVDNRSNFKVTGVYRDIPETNHFRFDIMLSLVTLDYNKDDNWLSNNFPTYIKLRKGADAAGLEAKFPQLVDKYAGPMAKLALGNDFTMEKFRASGNKLEYTLMPITDIHLKSDLTAEMGVNSDITYVYLFGAVALFILAIACVNFMNLSTARSANRAKEVGVRKVMGSLRSHLIRQFLIESIMVSVFSFILALAITWLILPSFNTLAGMQLSIPWGMISFWLVFAGGALVVGFLAGIYPSFFLSAFIPVNVLKGNVALGMKSGWIRSGLVVFQFWISIVLIIGTIAINNQLSFIQQKKVGFNKDQVISIKDTYALGDQVHAFKEEVLKDSRIVSGTVSSFLPVNGTSRNDNSHFPEGVQPTQDNLVSMQCWHVDYDYIKTLGMKIVQGRDFSRDFPSDSNAVILNQAALKIFNYEGDVVGRKISTFGEVPAPGQLPRVVSIPIIGVVEDFHFESLRENITPLGFFLAKSDGRVSFRFQASNTREVIESIEKTWKRMAPGMPFSYSFLDEDFGNMYQEEERLGSLFMVFATLAIVIACLGLFALTAFTAEQRTKEIGIRKVLGASVSSIIVLLSKEFGKLILISFILAAPLAWYGIDWWLQGFKYKTTIGFSVYVLAGFAAFAVSWLTMGYQSFRAASVDPVKSLRSE